jgi:ribonuclease E
VGMKPPAADQPTSRDEVPYEREDREDAQPAREASYERPDRYESREETRRPAASSPTFSAPPASAPPSHGFAPGAGVVEEEEIEDEESDALELGEDLDRDEFEDLEEETLEAEGDEEMIAAGSEVMEAVRDSHVEARARGRFEENASADNADDEGEDDGGDFEESESIEGHDAEHDDAEVLADGGEGSEGIAMGEGEDMGGNMGEEGTAPDHAELRGPSGTAGFQRTSERTERAPGDRGRDGGRFDRGGRGGRGRGRRGRGRPMRTGGGGGGGGRRNIQSAGRPQINELLKEGQEILVQIAKEPMGKKGARITSHIALPGRFLVYMPTVAHIGVSRKIGSDEERQRLKRILLSERDETKAHGGFIVRTAAAGASEDDLRADIRFLVNLWNEIKQRAESGKAPALIYHDLNLVERVLRDQVTQNFSHIWVDNEAEYERVLRFIGRFQPAMVKRVKLYTKDAPLFEAFNIQEEINKALKSKVWLKSGGYIVINQTEALVAIDVNTGKYVGKTGRLEDTIVKTNVDAIKEIVRQIRLRDLGGIIVIDFIDMDERRNRQKVMQALEEALRSDRAPSKVLQFNDFGLVAITRKRVKQSLERTLGQPCVYCTGTGLIKSVTTVCNEIYVEMRKMAKTMDKSDIMLRVNPEVGKSLKATGARWLQEMEELTKRTVIVKTDATLHQEQFDIQ